MADRLLGAFNPQDGKEVAPGPKRPRRAPLSYVAAVSTNSQATTTTTSSATLTNTSNLLQNVSDIDVETLVNKLQSHFQPSSTHSTVTTTELEQQFQACQKEIETIRTDLETSINAIQIDVASVKDNIKKQNAVILGFQREVTAALQDFAIKLYALTNLSATHVAATSKPQHLEVSQK